MSSSCERNWGVIEPVGEQDSSSLFRLFLQADKVFPNNPQHPVVIAARAFQGTAQEGEEILTVGGQWTSPWVWGIFPYHHYHSTAWELLLCIQGSAQVQLGGPKGPTVQVNKGDLLLIPPGVAHKQLETKGGFSLLGSYPTSGCSGSVDTLRGAPTEPQRKNIENCVPPSTEPILGLDFSKFYN